MNAKLITAAEINDGVRLHLTVAEAAQALGCSESRIRRAAKRAGVKRFAGRTVRGGLLIERHPCPIVIAYSA